MPTRSPKSNWCFLRNDPKLRTAVRYKIDTSPKTVKEMAAEAGVDAYRISRWINNAGSQYLSQIDTIKFCNYLGIDVRLHVEFYDESIE